MAISYPLTAPATPAPAAMTLRPSSTTGVAVSPFTGQQQVYKYAAHGWQMDVALPPMKRAQAEIWIAFLLSLSGRYGTFYMGDVTGKTPRGSLGGTPLINGAGQLGQTIITDGWTISTAGLLLPGDYIQIGTGLHRVLKSVDSDGSGNATMEIFPRVRTAPADNAPITTSNTVGLWRLAADENAIDIRPGIFYEIRFTAVEAF